jgi:hypothetical protein
MSDPRDVDLSAGLIQFIAAGPALEAIGVTLDPAAAELVNLGLDADGELIAIFVNGGDLPPEIEQQLRTVVACPALMAHAASERRRTSN